MFRDVARFKQKLPEAECIEILKSEPRGVLSVIGDDGYPYGMPMNHWYCEEDGKLYFHSGKQGHKVDAMQKSEKASFCVYDSGYRNEGDWALHIRSVIVFGHLEIIEDEETLNRVVRKLCYKFTDDEEYILDEFRRSGHRTLLYALVPEHMTGKLVREA